MGHGRSTGASSVLDNWLGWKDERVTAGGDPPAGYGRLGEPTPAHVWHSIAGCPISDELLEWPPDLFALTNVILKRSEAFRYALGPAAAYWTPYGVVSLGESDGQNDPALAHTGGWLLRPAGRHSARQ